MAKSRYDQLHDLYDPILTGKAGTRYERLAAMVWKALHQQNVVIHDIRLVGDSTVSHQIDVRMDRNGCTRRTLIECKDFDVAGHKVGLGIIRDFRSVIEDTGADEGIVVSCNGFSRHALTYAKAKDIKLIVLRTFEAADLEGRIQKIVFTIHVRGATKLTVERLCMTDQNALLLQSQMSALGFPDTMSSESDAFFVRGGERIQFNEFLTSKANLMANEEHRAAGIWTGHVKPNDWLIQVGQNSSIPFDGIDIRYELVDERAVSEIVSDRIAKMLVSGFGTDDIIIFSDQLERRRISPDGEVI